MSSSKPDDWQPVAPLPKTAPAEDAALTALIEDIKQTVAQLYSDVVFDEQRGERTGYVLIRTQGVPGLVNVTELTQHILLTHDVKVNVCINSMYRVPYLEIGVPRLIEYGFSERYSRTQTLQITLAIVAMCMGAVIFVISMGYMERLFFSGTP